jgi:hypothetical protein
MDGQSAPRISDKPPTSGPGRRLLETAAATATAAAAAVGTVVVKRRSGASSGPTSGPDSGWEAVTVNRPPDEVVVGGDQLAELARLAEIDVTAARTGWGSELRARPKASPDGEVVSRNELRAALRRAKQVIEVGEVLRVDPVPHGPRGHNPAGKAVDAVTRRAGGGTL